MRDETRAADEHDGNTGIVHYRRRTGCGRESKMKSQFDFRPKEPATEPTSIRALKAWMKNNGCNFLSYNIDSAGIAEGYILAPVGSAYHWMYTERGKETVVERFANECDAVSFAYQQIKSDGWAWSHMVGILDGKKELNALKESLTRMQIKYHEDSIPYGGKYDLRYRVFVHGSQADAVSDLRKKFGKTKT